ncbi:hydroxyisourate hydrolase [Acinetobacter equi]|uniref:5-hydroxyisourate hydrolase n=1 Tax=Acinetobacter equi TaxID=1324350 RepID=A0A0N9VNB7_9GAMM|nr:hydroxyisourate hydrolase [Acinetobacter equi]ALH94876.1 5-hydroxyisourate hydrolase [Acinetobacter equi]
MISTHILDTYLGTPASDVLVKLYDDQNKVIAQAFTNQDGRILATDFALNEINTGDYSLEFFTKNYYKSLSLETFYPKVVIHFSIQNDQQHYHIPLLISPFAYSSYRGS